MGARIFDDFTAGEIDDPARGARERRQLEALRAANQGELNPEQQAWANQAAQNWHPGPEEIEAMAFAARALCWHHEIFEDCPACQAAARGPSTPFIDVAGSLKRESRGVQLRFWWVRPCQGRPVVCPVCLSNSLDRALHPWWTGLVHRLCWLLTR